MNKPARSQRLLWIAGLSLLIVTAVGAGWVLNNGGDKDATDGGKGAKNKLAGPVFIGYGDSDPGVASLYPLQSGEVIYVIKEGTVVKKDDILLRVDAQHAKIKVEQAKAAVNLAKAELSKAERGPQILKRKIQQQEKAVDAAKFAKSAADKKLARAIELHNAKNLSLNEKLAAEEEVKGLQSAVEAAEERLLELKESDPNEGVRQAKANVALREEQLKEAEFALKKCNLVAPSEGLVLRVFVNPGEYLGAAPKGPAIQFAPAGPRIIRAEILQEWADHVKVGQEVIIEDDTRGGTRWTGKVRRLSEWYTARRSIIPEPLQQFDVRTLEGIIDITPEAGQHLKIGQRVRVTIKAEE
jgi:multidrug resistance efflux pump